MVSIGVPTASRSSVSRVPDLTASELLDGRIVGRSFDPAVPARVVVGAVAVVLAVRLVVLLVVRDEIVEREPVVAGDEVDALLRLSFLVAVDVGAAHEPRRDVGAPYRCRPSRSGGRRRGTGRSIPASCRRRRCRPDRVLPRPRPPRSASCRPAPGRTRCPRGSADGESACPTQSRDRIDARSKRKPSTCMSATQWRRLSRIIRLTIGVVRVQRVAGARVVRVAAAILLQGVVHPVLESRGSEAWVRRRLPPRCG